MVRILLAGASKSYISQKMVDNGYTILFLWPTNRLSHYFEVDTRKINNTMFFKVYLSCFTTLCSLSINSFVFDAGTCDARPAVSLQTSYPLCNRPKYSKEHTKTLKNTGPHSVPLSRNSALLLFSPRGVSSSNGAWSLLALCLKTCLKIGRPTEERIH